MIIDLPYKSIKNEIGVFISKFIIAFCIYENTTCFSIWNSASFFNTMFIVQIIFTGEELCENEISTDDGDFDIDNVSYE